MTEHPENDGCLNTTTRRTRSLAWHVLFQNHIRDRELGKLSQHVCLSVRALPARWTSPAPHRNLLRAPAPTPAEALPLPRSSRAPPAAPAAPPPPAPRRGPARAPPPRGRPPRKKSRSAAPCPAQRLAQGGGRSGGARRRAPRAPRPHATAGEGRLPPRELRARTARTAVGSRRHPPPEGRVRLPPALRTTRLGGTGDLRHGKGGSSGTIPQRRLALFMLIGGPQERRRLLQNDER